VLMYGRADGVFFCHFDFEFQFSGIWDLAPRFWNHISRKVMRMRS
jgi:hypothetical protein